MLYCQLSICNTLELLSVMNIADLAPDERLFMIEAADFEQSFPMLIAFVHDQHPEFNLPRKFEIAQALVERLCLAGLLQASVVTYTEKRVGFWEVTGSQGISFDALKSAWSNPYLWGRYSEESGGALFGIENAGRSCLALEPTPFGLELLAQ